MYERITSEEIVRIVRELSLTFGVKEELSSNTYNEIVHNVSAQNAAQGIARAMGLPIIVKLVKIESMDWNVKNVDTSSSALALRHDVGVSVENIAAQVFIPSNLPRFGTNALQGYPIEIHYCGVHTAHPEVFAALMTHELSHILMAVVDSRKKESELHVDILPLLLGFGSIISRGRLTKREVNLGDTVRTYTTKYGYLSDSQFSTALREVKTIRSERSHMKSNVLDQLKKVLKKVEKAEVLWRKVEDSYNGLDQSKPINISKSDGEYIVGMHANFRLMEWEHDLKDIREHIVRDIQEITSQTHYTSKRISIWETIQHTHQESDVNVNVLLNQMNEAQKILSRYTSLGSKMKQATMVRKWHS